MTDNTKIRLENIYNSYKQSEDATWNTEIQPQIESINEKYDSFFTEEQSLENVSINQKLDEARKNYKKGFNHFGYWMLAIFGLFFSLILIIPFYWALKKFKQMKGQRAFLQSKVDEAVNNKLEFLENTVVDLDLTEYFNDMFKITKFKNCGSLDDAVVRYIRENSLFNLNNNENHNTLSTSWGIFENNKIVVNLQSAKHHMINQEYVGSTMVKSGDNYITVTASVTKPKPVFEYDDTHWFFMSSCSNLEMSLEKTYPSANRNLMMNKQVLLENREFEKSFKWDYNDPVQVRMIFTPYTQEFYVANAFYKKDFRDNYDLTKIKSFIGNRCSENSASLNKRVLDVINNPANDLEDLEIAIRRVAIDKVHSSYLTLTPGWNLPILKSEDHTQALMAIQNSPKIPEFSTFHYILNKLFKLDVIRGETDTFHTIKDNFKFFSSFGNQIYGVKMEGLSFLIHSDVEYVTKWVGLTPVSVPVQYKIYEPIHASKNIFMTYVGNKWTHFSKFSLINTNQNIELSKELFPILQNCEEQGVKIVVEKDILAIICDDIPREQVISIFDSIIPIINKYN